MIGIRMLLLLPILVFQHDLLFFGTVGIVEARPFGAPICPLTRAAILGSSAHNNAQRGNWADQSFGLTIEGVAAEPNETTPIVLTALPPSPTLQTTTQPRFLTLTLETPWWTPFQGILIRATGVRSSGSGSGSSTARTRQTEGLLVSVDDHDDDDESAQAQQQQQPHASASASLPFSRRKAPPLVKVSDACEAKRVAGITHTSGVNKTRVTFLLDTHVLDDMMMMSDDNGATTTTTTWQLVHLTLDLYTGLGVYGGTNMYYFEHFSLNITRPTTGGDSFFPDDPTSAAQRTTRLWSHYRDDGSRWSSSIVMTILLGAATTLATVIV